jgi:hypothetical protein
VLLAAAVGLIAYWSAAENNEGFPAQPVAGYAAALAVVGAVVFLAQWVSGARSDVMKALGAVVIALIGLAGFAALWILSQN